MTYNQKRILLAIAVTILLLSTHFYAYHLGYQVAMLNANEVLLEINRKVQEK